MRKETLTTLRNGLHAFVLNYLKKNKVKSMYYHVVIGISKGAFPQFYSRKIFSVETIIANMCKANPEFEKKFNDLVISEYENYITNNYNNIDEVELLEYDISKLQQKLNKLKIQKDGE